MAATPKAPWAVCVAVLVAHAVPTATSLAVQATRRDEGAHKAGTYAGTNASAHTSLPLADFTVFDEASGSSNWAISGDNMFTQTSNIGSGTYCSADQLGTINYLEQFNMPMDTADYEWSVDAASEDNDAVGIVFRVRDNSNFYKYSHTNDGGGCRTVYKIKDGVRSEMWRAQSYSDYTQEYSAHYNFKVTTQGCHFVGYYNGVWDWEFTDSDCVPTGGVGLYSWGNDAGQWSNMQFTGTPSTTENQGAGATGDPHMQNVHGERFDLMRQGKVVLIEIPRGKLVENALLVVEADARRMGGHCADMYFQRLNITGAWADEAHTGGLTFDAHAARESRAEWKKFGPLELKVVHGRTEKGTPYLNFYVKHLGAAGFDVGGLLGEDDHAWVVTPEEDCVNTVSLSKASSDGHSAASSVAMAISA